MMMMRRRMMHDLMLMEVADGARGDRALEIRVRFRGPVRFVLYSEHASQSGVTNSKIYLPVLGRV